MLTRSFFFWFKSEIFLTYIGFGTRVSHFSPFAQYFQKPDKNINSPKLKTYLKEAEEDLEKTEERNLTTGLFCSES